MILQSRPKIIYSKYHLKMVLLTYVLAAKCPIKKIGVKKMKYHFKIHKDKHKGFWAECLELEGCRTHANTLSKLKKNMEDALNLYLSEPSDSKHLFPHPQKNIKGKNIIQIQVEPSVAIANRIREIRIRGQLTQLAMMNRLGIKNISNYQRLEDPERANPEWKTLLNIKKYFPHFKLDDL